MEEKNEKLHYTATCLFGLESLLGREIDNLGYKRIETIDGRVTFEGDFAACAVCNINLRFAERLYLNLGEFSAETFDNLFEGTKALPWEKYIGEKDAFPVKGHSIKSKLFSIPDCQRIVKKAVATRLGGAFGKKVLEETGVKYSVDFFILKDKASLMIDLTGSPLHKRGYRPETVEAPLRETLAAALVSFSRPRENVVLCDPFCGSGTIVIEAAMIMKNIAPGKNRTFVSENYPCFPKEMWDKARKEAEKRETENNFRCRASDISEDNIRIAKEAAKRAGVANVIDFRVKDAKELEKEGERGTIVTNPPYGERLMKEEGVEALYRDIGKAWKRLDMWQIYVITSHPDFQKLFGRKADKIRKLYNGMIPCMLYQYFKNDSIEKRKK